MSVSSQKPVFVKVLLAARFPVNTTDDNGDTALHLCTGVDHALIAKFSSETEPTKHSQTRTDRLYGTWQQRPTL